ncbi:hypothetical protein RR46_07315 [Papilio xuthus]|uniref:Serine/arginine repetitive matrix protein 1-like n=2 Tax=Papilio xuthus TaxID=66420 RepID=A0A194PX30_PAPXU|nr:hypothetical protein RR46_07315 [Papilio xuthus]
MLGARLKSWMEAQLGRAKKRKQKQSKPAPATTTPGPVQAPHLSSPESAYSTGYSTDGTSPGAPPATLAAPLVSPPPPPAPPTTHLYHEPAKRRSIPVVRCAEPVLCATPSPRPRCRIRTNPWLGAATPPTARRRTPLFPQQSLQCPQPTPQLLHAQYSLDTQAIYGTRSPHLSPHLSPERYRSPYYRGGVSSDEECRDARTRGRETAILSDADADSDGDTGLDGGDEDDTDCDVTPGRRRARRRRPPRRPPRSAGATPPRTRRRNPAPPAPPVRERDPLMEADREAERKYRELIREADKLLVTVSRAPLEPPHNPRIRELRATESEAPRRSPERTHVTNFIRANSPEAARRGAPAPRRSPLAAPPPCPPCPPAHALATDRPHSEPPKRKAYARDEVLQTLQGLRASLQQQSALLAVQRTRLDSL